MSQIEQTPLPPVISQLRQASATRWFALAVAALLVFLAYTALLPSGVFDASTEQIERWLLQRPITRADCLFYEWRNLGSVTLILAALGLLGLICLRLGYRWSVLVYLALLLFVCLVCELIGKSLLTQALPHSVSFGMTGLNCPQIHNQPVSVRLSAATGMWWTLPPASERLIARVHFATQNAFPFDGDDLFSSYPGGHAMRSSFVGLLACWLCWRHITRLVIRVPLMAVILIVSLSIGLMQFYLGAHLITDTIAGYVFGIAAACCAIGLLLLNGPRPKEPLAQPL
jgi:membrane-associated phospholipid phosphatase